MKGPGHGWYEVMPILVPCWTHFPFLMQKTPYLTPERMVRGQPLAEPPVKCGQAFVIPRNQVLRRARKRSVLPCLGGPAGCWFGPDRCYSGPGPRTSTTWGLESRSAGVSPSVTSDSLWRHGLYVGSSVRGILHARLQEWVAIPFFSRSSRPRDWTQVSHVAGRFFTIWATREAWELPGNANNQAPTLLRWTRILGMWDSGGHSLTSPQVILMRIQAWEALDENEVKKHMCRCG